MNYALKFGKRFDREFNKIDKSVSEQIVKKLSRLKEEPSNIGKPLRYTNPVLWGFKAENLRVFYIIKENLKETRKRQRGEEEKKEVIDDSLGVTPRYIMQKIGTELFRDQIPVVLPELKLKTSLLILHKAYSHS